MFYIHDLSRDVNENMREAEYRHLETFPAIESGSLRDIISIS